MVSSSRHPSRPAAFAVLHVADFPLQALLRASPDLATRPVALLEDERKRATVIALTPAAAAQGVQTGLTAPQAQARCPDLLVRTRQPALEAEALAALQAVGFTLSPLIEATAPGVITADVAALPETQREPLLTTALTQLAQLGFSATGGWASTPLLALYAARACREYQHRAPDAKVPSPESKNQTSEARLQNPHSALRTPHAPRLQNPKSPIQNPKSLLVVTDARAFLAPLPLAAAEPPAELVPILASWGLQTLGELTALSKADVVQRLGPAGLALWERAAGETARPLHAVAPPQAFAAALDLEHPVETLEPLLFLLRRFIDRVTVELRAAGLVAAELELRLPLEDETEHARSFRLPEPTADPDILFRTLQSHLETVHTDAAVIGVRLTFTPTRPLARQQGLFDTGLRDPHGFAETLARTVAIVGSGRVGTPTCDNSHRPDALTLRPPAPVIPPAEPAPVLAPLGPVLRRFRPPWPAKVELVSRAVRLTGDGSPYHQASPKVGRGVPAEPEGRTQERASPRLTEDGSPYQGSPPDQESPPKVGRGVPAEPEGRTQERTSPRLTEDGSPYQASPPDQEPPPKVGRGVPAEPEERTQERTSPRLTEDGSPYQASPPDQKSPPKVGRGVPAEPEGRTQERASPRLTGDGSPYQGSPPYQECLPESRPRSATAATSRPLPGPVPAYVWTESLHGAVVHRRGPWRGSGDWWQRDQQWEREEWDIALTTGGLYRLVRTPQGWWLEGEYD